MAYMEEEFVSTTTFQIFQQYIHISQVPGKNFILPAQTVLIDNNENIILYFNHFHIQNHKALKLYNYMQTCEICKFTPVRSGNAKHIDLTFLLFNIDTGVIASETWQSARTLNSFIYYFCVSSILQSMQQALSQEGCIVHIFESDLILLL